MKKIAQQIKRIFLYPLFILNERVKKTNWYLNQVPDLSNYPTNDWYRNNLVRNYDIVNLGSSSAYYGFDYTGLDVKAFNWALQPQSMEYSFRVLKNFFSILKQDGIVIIPLSPFSGLSVEGKWSVTANDKYFHVLYPELIDNYEGVASRRIYPIFKLKKLSIKKLFKDDKKLIKYKDVFLCNCSSDFEKDAERWVNSWMNEFGIEDLNSPLSIANQKGMSLRVQLLTEMINFCKDRNLKPILVMQPIHSSLLKLFTEEFQKNYIYNFIEKINRPDVPFYDHIALEEFQQDEFFMNSFFMNENGARKYTQFFLNQVGLI